MDKHAVIIGGGISGLTAAYYLSRQGIPKVTVLEASDRSGGVIRTLRGDLFHMEAAADTFDGREPAVFDLCGELGLRGELLECRPALHDLFLSKNKKILPVNLSDPAGIFKSRVLGFRSRARLLLEAVIPVRKEDSDESIAAFVKRRFGDLFLKELVEPLVRGVLMADADALSLREYFPLWRVLEREHGSLIKAVMRQKKPAERTGPFFTIRGGLDRLVLGLTERLERVNLEQRSEAVSVKHEGCWKILVQGGRVVRADAVCFAMPAHAAARLLWNFAPSLAGELVKIRYDSIAAVNLVYPSGTFPKKFHEGGFLVPVRGEKWPFACLKSIGLTEDGRFSRFRAFISEELQPEVFPLDDETLKREVFRRLALAWGLQALPARVSVERYPKALAQYGPGHGQLVLGIEKMLLRYPGLFLAGNGYHGFGVSDCVREAVRAARELGSFLETAAQIG